MGAARYDGLAEWCDRDFLAAVPTAAPRDAALRLLGDGQSFLAAGLALERFEELENRPYPFGVALRCRR